MRKRRPSRLLMLMVVILVLTTCGSRVHTWYVLKAQKDNLLAQKNQLLEINRDLTKSVEELESNDAIEKLAREKLGMIKPGEQLMLEFSSPSN